MIHTKVFAATLLLTASIAVPAAAACDPGERVLRFSIVTAVQGHPKGEAALGLAERVNEEFDGQLCMEVYGNSELFDDDAIFNALLEGEAELAAPSLSKFGQYTDQLQLFDLPFLFDGPLEVMAFQETEAAQGMLASIEDDGFVGLSFLTNGMKQMSADRPLLRPEDATGVTFRIQPSAVIEAQFAAIGAASTPMAFSQVYDALANGVVQGQENTWSNIYTKNFHTVQDGVTETNHGYLGYLIIVSQGFLDSLDPDVRERFEFLVELTAHEHNRFAFEINELMKGYVRNDGVEVVTLDEPTKAAWRQAFEPVWSQFADGIGRDLIAAALEANKADKVY